MSLIGAITDKKEVKLDTVFKIGILSYPTVIQSGIFGIDEILNVANKRSNYRFVYNILPIEDNSYYENSFDAIVILPGLGLEDKNNITNELVKYLRLQSNNGSYIGCACSGIFLLAEAGLAYNKLITIQNSLEDKLLENYPSLTISYRNELIQDGNIITTAGVTKWSSLIIKIIYNLAGEALAKELSDFFNVPLSFISNKNLVNNIIYKQVTDSNMEKARRYILNNYKKVDFEELSGLIGMSRRTFNRKFLKVFEIKPNMFLQKVRIYNALNLLENTNETVDFIVKEVGYEDVSSFRKLFKSETGFTPQCFRKLN